MEQESFDLLIKKNGSKNLSWMTHRLSYDKDDIENALSKHWVLEKSLSENQLIHIWKKETQEFKTIEEII